MFELISYLSCVLPAQSVLNLCCALAWAVPSWLYLIAKRCLRVLHGLPNSCVPRLSCLSTNLGCLVWAVCILNSICVWVWSVCFQSDLAFCVACFNLASSNLICVCVFSNLASKCQAVYFKLCLSAQTVHASKLSLCLSMHLFYLCMPKLVPSLSLYANLCLLRTLSCPCISKPEPVLLLVWLPSCFPICSCILSGCTWLSWAGSIWVALWNVFLPRKDLG